MTRVVPLLSLVLVVAACKKDGDVDTDTDVGCAQASVEVPVTVLTLDEEPISDAEVTITLTNPSNPTGAPDEPLTIEEDCTASGVGMWTCTAYPGDINQVNVQSFPVYQPASAVAYVDGPDCGSVAIELRMVPMTK